MVTEFRSTAGRLVRYLMQRILRSGIVPWTKGGVNRMVAGRWNVRRGARCDDHRGIVILHGERQCREGSGTGEMRSRADRRRRQEHVRQSHPDDHPEKGVDRCHRTKVRVHCGIQGKPWTERTHGAARTAPGRINSRRWDSRGRTRGSAHRSCCYRPCAASGTYRTSGRNRCAGRRNCHR